jgi:hypothetical protein
VKSSRMQLRTLPALICFLSACLAPVPTSVVAADQVPPPSAIASPPPGEGVFCMYAFLVVAQQVGRRCFAGQDSDLQAQLDASVSAFDEYVRRNSDATPADIAKFKADQGHEGAPSAVLCHGDALRLYEMFRSKGATFVRSWSESMVARPGRPTWGDCV